MEELNRATAENKKLTDMLSAMCENYSELKKQLLSYTNKQPCTPSSRKRNLNGLDGTGNFGLSTSSSSEDDSCKKMREELIKEAKITQVHVRTEASDASLVSCSDASF